MKEIITISNAKYYISISKVWKFILINGNEASLNQVIKFDENIDQF